MTNQSQRNSGNDYEYDERTLKWWHDESNLSEWKLVAVICKTILGSDILETEPNMVEKKCDCNWEFCFNVDETLDGEQIGMWILSDHLEEIDSEKIPIEKHQPCIKIPLVLWLNHKKGTYETFPALHKDTSVEVPFPWKCDHNTDLPSVGNQVMKQRHKNNQKRYGDDSDGGDDESQDEVLTSDLVTDHYVAVNKLSKQVQILTARLAEKEKITEMLYQKVNLIEKTTDTVQDKETRKIEDTALAVPTETQSEQKKTQEIMVIGALAMIVEKVTRELVTGLSTKKSMEINYPTRLDTSQDVAAKEEKKYLEKRDEQQQQQHNQEIENEKGKAVKNDSTEKQFPPKTEQEKERETQEDSSFTLL